MLQHAFESRASDIHVEPKREESLIRFRIDGVLHEIQKMPKIVHAAVIVLPGTPSSTVATLSTGVIAAKSGVSAGWPGTLVRPARCASRTARNTRSAPAATPAVLLTRSLMMNA
jgi:hypothetical protein